MNPVYLVVGQVNYLKKDGKLFLLVFKESDETGGSKLLRHDVTIEEGRKFEKDYDEPEKTEISVELAEYQGNKDHRLMPLNDQGKFAMLYRDDQF